MSKRTVVWAAAGMSMMWVAGGAAAGGWQEHQIKQGDGRGGWIVKPARKQNVARWRRLRSGPDGQRNSQ